METKYYTPDISEFFVGFEYEELFPDKWKHVYMDIFELEGCNLDSMIYSKDLRVKYLDKEDIEELGFEGNESNSVYFSKKDCLTSAGTNFLDCRLVHWFGKENRELDIYAVYGKDDENLIFRGIIKNKSELKKLLKQLNIN